MQYIRHATGIATPDGIGDFQNIPTIWGACYGENTGFGPEAAGIVVVKRQVEELAWLEAGNRSLRYKINGIDVITMIFDFLDCATNFLWCGHFTLRAPQP